METGDFDWALSEIRKKLEELGPEAEHVLRDFTRTVDADEAVVLFSDEMRLAPINTVKSSGSALTSLGRAAVEVPNKEISVEAREIWVECDTKEVLQPPSDSRGG